MAVSGTPSETSTVPARLPRQRFDPPVQRETLRITNLYGTAWEPVEHLGGTGTLTQYLRFGRLAGYYDRECDQLPAVAAREDLDVTTVRFSRWGSAGELIAARLWILIMASGQAVVGFTVDIDAPVLDAIDLLEDCYYLDVTVGGIPLEDFACHLADRLSVPNAEHHGLAAERHQILFARDLAADDPADVIQKLIYRSNLPYREEFSAITYPAELNRRPGARVAVGPYVSVMCGQQDYVENGAFVSAAQAVASAVRLREIRDLAYEDVRLFRDAQAAAGSLHTRRHMLERMSNQLGNLELELSFSVESSADLAILVPSLRVAAYHDALYECMGMLDKATTVGRMLQRLERSINAELTAIESVERRADEDRRTRWTVAVGFLSTVALPITLVLTFFGINAREVDGDLSMFSHRYWLMYTAFIVLMALGLTLSIGLYLQQRRQSRHDARRAAEATAAVRNMAIVRRRPSGSDKALLPVPEPIGQSGTL